MTKDDIVEAVREKLIGFAKRDATKAVETVIDTIKETVVAGEAVKITGFGAFVLHDKRQRPGRDPQTGEKIVIAARRVVTFRLSGVLRRALNR